MSTQFSDPVLGQLHADLTDRAIVASKYKGKNIPLYYAEKEEEWAKVRNHEDVADLFNFTQHCIDYADYQAQLYKVAMDEIQRLREAGFKEVKGTLEELRKEVQALKRPEPAPIVVQPPVVVQDKLYPCTKCGKEIAKNGALGHIKITHFPDDEDTARREWEKWKQEGIASGRLAPD
jgi:hypothetical protein